MKVFLSSVVGFGANHLKIKGNGVNQNTNQVTVLDI